MGVVKATFSQDLTLFSERSSQSQPLFVRTMSAISWLCLICLTLAGLFLMNSGVGFFTDSFDNHGAGCGRRLENGTFCEFNYDLEFEPMWSVTLTIATAIVGLANCCASGCCCTGCAGAKCRKVAVLVLGSLSLIPLATSTGDLSEFISRMDEDFYNCCASNPSATSGDPLVSFGALHTYGAQQFLIVLLLILFTIALLVATWRSKSDEGSSGVLPVTIPQGVVNPVYLVPTPGMSPNGGAIVSPMMGAQGYPASGSLVNVGSHLVNGPQPPLVYLAPGSQVGSPANTGAKPPSYSEITAPAISTQSQHTIQY